ncbi:MAG: tRNA dihydrouridine synthase DusB [Clostridia bacterium]
MKIGNYNIKGRAVLAPMAGVTDVAFRNICYAYGSAFSVTEMISSRALIHNYKKTFGLMDISRDDGPVGIQIFGDDPLIMAKATELASELKPIFIDVNMGCPVPKIAGNNCGSALMKTPNLCGEIVKEMTRVTDIPITVKIRKGWDDNSINALEVAKICEQSGAQALTIHGRTRMQMYKPSADWDIIREVKENLSIPVIGNGDVTNAEQAAKMLSHTNCDAVMVARSALGRPWIFSEINANLVDNLRILPEPPISKKLLVIRKQMEQMCEIKGEEKAMREARKHIAWYMHGIKGAAEFRRRSGTLCSLKDLDVLLQDVYIKSKTDAILTE